MVIFRRTEKANRVMYGITLTKESSQKLMDLLSLEETLNKITTANRVPWY